MQCSHLINFRQTRVVARVCLFMKERFTIERFQCCVLSISNTGYVVCISNSFSFAPTAAAALLVAFWFCGNPRPPTRDDDKWMRRFFLYVFLLHFVLLFYSNVASAPASLVSDVWTTPPALRRLPIHLEMARFQLGDFLQKVLGHYFFLVLGFVWWKCCLTCRPITWSIEQWYPKEPPLLSLLLALFL